MVHEWIATFSRICRPSPPWLVGAVSPLRRLNWR
jgi:hypothetical protein